MWGQVTRREEKQVGQKLMRVKRNLGTVAAIRHTGGRLFASVTRRTAETGVWSGRPRIATGALVNTGAYSYVNPDQSLRMI